MIDDQGTTAAPAQQNLAPDAPSAPQQQQQPSYVMSPEGELHTMDPSEVSVATQNGWSVATPEDINRAKYGGFGQQALGAAEGAAEAATFGGSTAAEVASGLTTPEDIAGRREAGPGHIIGQAIGLAGSTLIPGLGEANLLEHAGASGAEALGMGAEASGLRAFQAAKAAGASAKEAASAKTAAMAAYSTPERIGSAAAKAAVENAGFQTGDEFSKMFSDQSDPNTPVQTAAINVGLAGLIGAPFGAAGAGVGALWDAASGSKLGSVLKGVSDKLGGVENPTQTALDSLIEKTGIHIEPEIKARLTADPVFQQWAKTLEQSDTTSSGRAYQEAFGKFKSDLNDAILSATGKDRETALSSELSHAAHGKNIGETASNELDQQIKPLSDQYDAIRAKNKGVQLAPSIADKSHEVGSAQLKAVSNLEKLTKQAQKAQESGDPAAAIEAAAKVQDAQEAIKNLQTQAKAPGTVDSILSKVGNMASKNGWATSPSSDTMAMVTQLRKELPNLKNLNDLSNYTKEFGSTIRKSMDGQTRFNGYQMQRLLREAESDIMGAHIGSEEGSDALARFTQLRQQYAAKAQLKDAIEDRLHTGEKSVSGYAKAVKKMGHTDGETLARRLSGKNDSDLLNIINTHLPETAKAVRQYHLDQLAQTAVNRGKAGAEINGKAILNAIRNDKMSPELRNFILSPDAQGRIEAAGTLMQELDKLPHNFSNTARTLDKLMEHVPSSVITMAGMLGGHNPALSLLAGHIGKLLGKDVPDAIRLATLKFLGSDSGVSAPGFKAAVDFIENTRRGENQFARAAKAVFTAGREVLPESMIPTQRDRDKLQKTMDKLQEESPDAVNSTPGLGHYLPNQHVAVNSTAANAVNYLKSTKPTQIKASPLDAQPPVSPGAKAQYNRNLDIAHQPLVIMQHIKNGSLLPQDVTALKTMYPALYNKMTAKFTEHVMDNIGKGEAVPYKTRMSLSLFIGQALDSTMTPQGILGAQPMPPQQQPQGGAPGNRPKHSTTALNKGPKGYQTPNQAAEERRTTRE